MTLEIVNKKRFYLLITLSSLAVILLIGGLFFKFHSKGEKAATTTAREEPKMENNPSENIISDNPKANETQPAEETQILGATDENETDENNTDESQNPATDSANQITEDKKIDTSKKTGTDPVNPPTPDPHSRFPKGAGDPRLMMEQIDPASPDCFPRCMKEHLMPPPECHKYCQNSDDL